MAKKSSIPGFFGLFWRLSLIAVILFSVTGVAGYMTAERLIRTPETESPDLLTLELRDAVTKASSLGFSVIIEKKEPTTLLKEGHILSQRPSPGVAVKVGSTVRLTISEKP
ncbi:PASTA domain-containing protein [Candidatus Sumerlaeota bacterium]|nr:PASTA domain-containing protein [Candidatus Sumerlaeota bacterium]